MSSGRRARSPYHILLSTLGGSPKTVTEVLGALAFQGTRIDEVWLLRTRGSRDVPAAVRAAAPGTPRWRSIALGVDDLLRPEDVRAASSAIYRAVRRACVSTTAQVHLDLTGGRKTLSTALAFAGQMHLRPGDAMYHVEPRARALLDPRSSQWYPLTAAEVSLVSVPFISLRPLAAAVEGLGLRLDGEDLSGTIERASDLLARLSLMGLRAAGAEHEASKILVRTQRAIESKASRELADAVDGDLALIDGILRSLLAVGLGRPIEREPCDAVATVRDALAWARGFGTSGDRPTTVVLRVAPGLGKPLVGCDEVLLRFLVLHLLRNAAQHGASRATVALREQGGQLEISVANDGRPLPVTFDAEAIVPYQAGPDDGGLVRSRGVGLAFSRAVLGSVGGGLRIERRRGSGPRVTLVIPLDRGRSARHEGES